MSTLLASGHVLIGAQIAPALAGMAKVQAAFGKTGVEGSRMSRGILAAVKPAAIGLGLMTVGAIGAVKAAGNFQSSLNDMQAVSGATAKQMKAVSKAAIALGADTKLPGTSAKDAAEAMVQLAKGGFSVDQAMKASRGTLTLAAAAGIDNATAATIQADALNGFGLEASQAGRVADILAASANASTAEITDMAMSLAQSSAVAKQAGWGIEDTATAISMLANAGIKGSDAGTSLKTMLLRLQAPMGTGAKAIAKYGINLRDNSGAMLKQAALAKEFQRRLGGLSKAERDRAMAAIFGTDAIRAGNVLLGASTKAINKQRKASTEQGAAQALAAAKMKGFNGAVEGFRSALETLVIQIGSALLPAFTAIVRALTRVAEWASRNQTTLKVLGIAAAGLGTAILVVAAALKVMAIAQALVNAVMLANPIVLVAAALIGLGAALVLAYRHSATFRAVVQAAFAAVTGAAKTLVSAFQAVLSWVRGNWKTIAVLISGPFAPLVALATDAFGVRSALVGAFAAMVGAVRSAMSAIKGAVSGAVGAVTSAARAVGKGIITGVKAGVAAIRSIYQTMWTGISGAISAAVDAALGAAAAIGRAIIDGVVSGLGGLAGAIRDKVTGALSSALSNIDIPGFSPVDHAAKKAIADPIINGAARGIEQQKGKLKLALTKTVKEAITSARQNAASMASGLAGMIGSGIDNLLGRNVAALGNSPEAQRMRAIEDQQKADAAARERARLDKAITDADPADRAAAVRDLNDWLLEQERTRIADSLALQEKALRDEADAKKTAAERGLADLTDNLNRGLTTQEQFNRDLATLLASAAPEYASSGALLGSAFAAGFQDTVAALMRQAGLISGGPGVGLAIGPGVENPTGVQNAETRQRLASALTNARAKAEKGRDMVAKAKAALDKARADAAKASGPGGASITAAEQSAITGAANRLASQQTTARTLDQRSADAQKALADWNKAHRAAGGGIIGGVGRRDKVPVLAAPGEGFLSRTGMDQLTDAAFGRGGGATRQTFEVTIHLNGPVIAGGRTTRELGDELARIVAPALNRRVTLATG